MHHILARTGFSPEGLIFPVSAAIVRDQRGYDQVLEGFSDPLFRYTEWFIDEENRVHVTGPTRDLYRFFDATPFAEYLHDKVADTVRTDLRDELNFISIFDQAMDGVRRIVDMPDRRASLLVRLCMQNGGRLSQNKRDTFAELEDHEIASMEAVIQKALASIHRVPEVQPAFL